MGKLESIIKKYGRVLKITKKPTKEEYKMIVKVSGIGMMVMGLIGFLIHLIKQVITG